MNRNFMYAFALAIVIMILDVIGPLTVGVATCILAFIICYSFFELSAEIREASEKVVVE